MANGQAHLVLRHVRSILAAHDADRLSDRELLRRFHGRRDEAAFTALVRRHGPMVLGVCRRVLPNLHDADDAFPATFFTLARKAGAGSWNASIGPWLQLVAYRLALRIQAEAERRSRHESRATPRRPADPLATVTGRELCAVIDAELSALPDRLRAPLLLCCLEGQTRDEAARRLGWSLATLKRRLDQGREQLRLRLHRRGLVLPAALVGLLAVEGAQAALPGALVQKVIEAASAGVAATARVAALSQKILQNILLSKGKIVACVLLAVCTAIGVETGLSLTSSPAVDDPGPVKTAVAHEAKKDATADSRQPQPDQHGDPLPPDAVARLGSVRLRHGSAVHGLAFAPDGKTVASAGNDDTVRIWDVATGKELTGIEAANQGGMGLGAMLGIDFSPDGKTLAIAQINRPPGLMEIASSKMLKGFGEHALRASWITFSTDGKITAFAGRTNVLYLADVASGEILHSLTGHEGIVYRVVFSPDGKTFASSSNDKTIRLWDLDTARELRRFEGTPDASGCLAFAPDGKTLASGNHANALIRLWDVATAKEIRSLTLKGKRDQVLQIVFTPDGKSLISGHEDGRVRFWDVTTGKETRQLRTGGGSMRTLALSRDGKVLATTPNSLYDNAVQLWDAATGKSLNPPASHYAGIGMLAFSPNSKLVVGASWDGTIHVAEATSGKVLHRLKVFGHLAITPDGKSLVTGGWSDGKVRIWDMATGAEVRQFPAATRNIASLALLPDGKTLVTTGYDKMLRLWDLATGRQLHDFGGTLKSDAFHLALSVDGKMLATIHANHSLILWETATGKLVRRIQESDNVGSAAFSPDGKILASTISDRNTRPRIVLRDTATGKEVGQLAGNGDPMDAIAFSPDGRTLIWGGQHEKELRVWEVRTRQERKVLHGHAGLLSCVAFAPNGKLMASGSADGTALIWDTVGPSGADKPVPLAADEQKTLWADLAGENAATAFDALRRLNKSPQQAVALVRQFLGPVPAANAKQLAGWLRDLDSEQFETRENATRELAHLGESAEPDLRKVLEDQPSPEVRRRAEKLLENCSDRSPARLRADRALELLERLGTLEARRLLQTYAAGAPDAWLTREAKAALDRLVKQAGVP